MASQPPSSIERLVRLLLPPASREHVVGDLSERYRSSGRYLMDAVGVLPFIIASQVRRTCDFSLLAVLMILFVLLNGHGEQRWFAAAIPAVLAMAVLTLADAYRPLGSMPLTRTGWASAAHDVLLVAVAVLACQGVLLLVAPQWQVPQRQMIIGFPLFCVALFLVRLRRLRGLPQSPPVARSMSAGELLREARGFEAIRQRGVRIALAGGLVYLAACLVLLWTTPAPIVKIASALGAVTSLLLTFSVRTQLQGTRLPHGVGFAQSLTRYRCSLERQCQLVRTVRWYVVLLVLGPGTFELTAALHRHDMSSGLYRMATVLALCVAGLWATQRAQARYERRIKQLAMMREDPFMMAQNR